MNCPACQMPLTYKEKGHRSVSLITLYYEAECFNPYCLDSSENTRFWGFADHPSKYVNDYELNVEVDGEDYDFWSSRHDRITEIWKPSHGTGKSVANLYRFYPVIEDIFFYENLIRKVMNLKVFL